MAQAELERTLSSCHLCTVSRSSTRQINQLMSDDELLTLLSFDT